MSKLEETKNSRGRPKSTNKATKKSERITIVFSNDLQLKLFEEIKALAEATFRPNLELARQLLKLGLEVQLKLGLVLNMHDEIVIPANLMSRINALKGQGNITFDETKIISSKVETSPEEKITSPEYVSKFLA